MAVSKAQRLAFTRQAEAIVAEMTLAEKVDLMSGKVVLSGGGFPLGNEDPTKNYNYVPYPTGANKKYGVPAVRFCDGPRGVVSGYKQSTCFPVTMLRGATFNPVLEEAVGQAIGTEIRAYGGNLFGGVCINLPYHPGWGRSQETYGEDSFHLGAMGAALTRGVQSENVMATIKHYAFNSMENSRFDVSIDCDRRTEREVFLPHFKDCIDAGAAAVMSAYNRYKDTYCGHSDYLLRKVLKEEWDFDGFVMSDFIYGVRDAAEGVNNGEDLEMCSTIVYGDKLIQAVAEGKVPEARVDEAALRLIRTGLAFEAADAKEYGPELIGSATHRELALQVAQEGITLLKNNNHVLPLAKTERIAVIGDLAQQENTGDHGSSHVRPEYVVTPLAGLEKLLSPAQVTFDDGTDLARAQALAEAVDAVIFVVGFDHDDEGEYVTLGGAGAAGTASFGGDRQDLDLSATDIALLKTVGPLAKKSTAVLIGGNTIMLTEWQEAVDSIIMAFYPGQEGGNALAQIIFGEINPSGKLPYVQPVSASDLPQINWETSNQWYDYFHGYAKLEKEGVAPFLPYGFGLSYTTFAVSDVAFKVVAGTLQATCTVTNTGTRAGSEVIQLYVGFENSQVIRPVKVLRGFNKVNLAPGERQVVTITCPLEKLHWYNPQTASFELEEMEYEVYLGTSSRMEDLTQGHLAL